MSYWFIHGCWHFRGTGCLHLQDLKDRWDKRYKWPVGWQGVDLCHKSAVLFNSSSTICHGQGYCRGSNGMAGVGELDFVRLKEVRNPEFCASGYLIRFCPLNLLKCMILLPKSWQVCVNNMEMQAVIKFFSCKARRWRKYTPFWQKH